MDTKALFRRCQALESLDRFNDAFKDARQMIHFDPKNKAAEPVLRRLAAKIENVVKEQNNTSNKVKQMFHFMFDNGDDNTPEKRKQVRQRLLIPALRSFYDFEY